VRGNSCVLILTLFSVPSPRAPHHQQLSMSRTFQRFSLSLRVMTFGRSLGLHHASMHFFHLQPLVSTWKRDGQKETRTKRN
jgi:hypothetical protein